MLVLNSLSLKNFMCCKDVTLTFPQSGLVILQGENGQGKSAILEAIALCLMEHKRADSYKEYVKFDEKSAQINLDCDYNDEKILFDIKISEKGTTTRDVLYKGKHYLNSEVTTLLTDLEINFYADIILSMQDTNNITKMTPVQRATLLQKLFQFDFEKEVENINNSISTWERSRDNLINDIKTFESLINQKERLFETKKGYMISKEDYLKLKEKINNLKSNLTTTLYNEYNVLASEIKTLNIDLINKKNELNKINQTKITLDNLKAELKSYEDKLSSFKINDFNEKKNLINNAIIDNEKELELLRQKKDSYQNEINKCSFEIKDLKDHLILAEKGKCPTCGQDIKNIDITQLAKNVESLEKLQIENKAELNSIINKISKFEQIIKANRNSLIEINKAEATQSSQLFYLKENKNRLVANIKATGIIGDDKDILSKIEEIKYNLNIKEESLKNIKVQIDKIVLEKQDYEKCEKKIADYDSITQYNLLVEQKNNQLTLDIENLKQRITDNEQKKVEANLQIDSYKEAKKILDTELPNYLIIKTCAKLEEAMNTFIQVVFPDMSVILKQSKKGVEFFYSKGSKMLSTKMASGFEKAVLSIAFKVALCLAYGLSFSALDEVDSAASEENSEKLFSSLISENIFKQLIIITHKPSVCDTIKNLSDNCYIYRVDKGNFFSEI